MPQMPTVFPAFFQPTVPAAHDLAALRAFLTPQEWRAFWEKWLAAAPSVSAVQDEPPPMYTPRADEEGVRTTPASEVKEASSSSAAPLASETPVVESLPTLPERVATRRPVYEDDTQVPEQEVDSFTYQPIKKKGQQIRQKEDRMLLLFWIPILIIALVWGFFHGVRLAMNGVRSLAPLRGLVRM